MATPIVVTCPECERRMKVPAEVRGKKIRCKACGGVFVAKGEPARGPARKPAAEDEDEGEAKPYGVTTVDLTPRCPHCANEMEEGDIVCLHCGYNTRTRQHHRTKKAYDVTGGQMFLWLMPGILCVIAVILLITFDVLYATLVWGQLNKDDWYYFLGSGACTLWFIILSLFCIYKAGRFALKRLIFEPKPPEVEKF
jgi:hypothetical protein